MKSQKRIRLVSWAFDTKAWGTAISTAREALGKSLPEFLEVDRASCENWEKGRYTGDFRWPSMKNFFKICNLLDLDPRDFFILEDEDEKSI